MKKGMLTLFIIFFLISCGHYKPTLYPSYDVLNPGENVRKNPIGFTEDGNAIVNEAFLIWVLELKREIIKLREN